MIFPRRPRASALKPQRDLHHGNPAPRGNVAAGCAPTASPALDPRPGLRHRRRSGQMFIGAESQGWRSFLGPPREKSPPREKGTPDARRARRKSLNAHCPACSNRAERRPAVKTFPLAVCRLGIGTVQTLSGDGFDFLNVINSRCPLLAVGGLAFGKACYEEVS